jgi:hypothetical protein
VVQPRAVVVLPDEAPGRVDIACEVPVDAIGSEELVALECGPARRVVEVRDQTAPRIHRIELRAVAVGGACGPLRQVIQEVVGEGAGRAVGHAAGDVAKAIVAFCYVGFFLRFSSRLRFRSCSSCSAFAASLYRPNACSAFIFPT